MNYNALKITKQRAENILYQLFSIKGEATELPGEVDFNFKIRVSGKSQYILKISRVDEDENHIDFQQKLLQFIEENSQEIIIPKIITDKNGNSISEIKDADGSLRKVRLLTWISGRVWSSVNPQLDDLRFCLGKQCGLLTRTLQDFKHKEAHRNFDWDVAQSLWTENHLHLFSSEEKAILSSFQQQFKEFQNTYTQLRKSIVHNDVNDNNSIVSDDVSMPKVKAIIDYGDAICTQIINDVAITCAYAIMHQNDPLAAALPTVKGYHHSFPLQEKELAHLYTAIAMRLVISVTKSAINKIKEPENIYLLISEKPARELLKKWQKVPPEFAYYSFRNACEYTPHPNEDVFEKFALKNTYSLTDLFPEIHKKEIHVIDLSVASTWIGHQEAFNNLDVFQFKLNQLQKEMPSKIIAGGYLEPRPIYTSTAYDTIGNNGYESRTIHLGTDFWLPEKTPVHTFFKGEVVIATNDAGEKGYGGLLVLKHQEESVEFFTLYGHLTVESATKYAIGDCIEKGEKIAELGNFSENGNWVPHLHFQILLSLFDYKNDFPGVTYFSQLAVWKSVCPNPNLLFQLQAFEPKKTIENAALIAYRKQHLGKGMSLQYNTPIEMVRGAGQYLMDATGKKYLDTVNNVAHVGHENYKVVKAGQEQMALLNTNSRYLHENINRLAQEIIEKLPPTLNVVHFVNSGSEANELAIRMAKVNTGAKDVIASEMGYHGNTNTCVAISSYKFDGKGGEGAPEHTHIFPLPDVFRGKYSGEKAGEKYAEEVKQQIKSIHAKGRKVAAFIVEPIISCGGQIELPEGFLSKAYDFVRAAGGLCISDEIQTGCGRMGKTFWGFQLHNVVPDIVTIGKPLGNGHPLAAVVCTQEVADKFANGMEYFNTFGGNPVSCAIGTAVLQTVKREKLQENALTVGCYLKAELTSLAKEFPMIGDVRGQGLFLGFELVDATKNPLAKQTEYLINRMKDFGVLMSSDGPNYNVIKIKPPIIFTKENAKQVVFYLKKVLLEDVMQI